MPGTPDWGGTTQASGHDVLINTALLTLTQGLNHTESARNSRPGYTIQLTFTNQTAGGAVLNARVEIAFTDSATGTVVDRVSICALASVPGSQHFITGRGPMSGDTISVKVINNSVTAQTLQFDIYVAAISGTPSRHDYRTDDQFAFNISGWTASGDDVWAGYLMSSAGLSIAGGANDEIILPFYIGLVQIAARTPSATTDLAVVINNQGDNSIATGVVVWHGMSDSLGQVNALVYLPASQCTIKIANTGTTTRVIPVSVIIAEQGQAR